MASDFDALKDVPGYRMIMKAILKSQIQHLVEQLSKETEEESVILTASMSDGMLCHLGSNSGKIFLDNHEELKSQFLNFCLKEKHAKEQAASAVEDQLSFHNPSPGLVKSVTTHSGRRVKPVSKDIPLASTPHGRRYQPYSTRKPSKTATSTITSPTSPSSSIEIQPIAVNEQSESIKGTPQKEHDMSMSDLSTVKVEPMDSGYLALPETIEGYRIVQNETEPDANDNDIHGESPGDTVTTKQTGQSESSSTKTKKQLTGAGAQLGVDSVGPNASNNAIKSESFSEFDMDASKPESDNDESLDMSGLEQPGPSGISASGTSPAKQRKTDGRSTPYIKRKRIEVPRSVKTNICRYKEKNPKAALKKIRDYMLKTQSLDIGLSTLGDILRAKDKWLNLPKDSPDVGRDRSPKHLQLEDSLLKYFLEIKSSGLCVDSRTMIEKAKSIGKQLGIKDFSYSTGWFQRFKIRKGIDKQS